MMVGNPGQPMQGNMPPPPPQGMHSQMGGYTQAQGQHHGGGYMRPTMIPQGKAEGCVIVATSGGRGIGFSVSF